MRNKYAKKQQKKINKVIKGFNENIANDPLWKGRFCIRQLRHRWEKDWDSDCGILSVELDIYDKQKGIHLCRYFQEYEVVYSWRFFTFVNDFIIDTCKVWDEHPTRETTIDYRNVEYKYKER